MGLRYDLEQRIEKLEKQVKWHGEKIAKLEKPIPMKRNIPDCINMVDIIQNRIEKLESLFKGHFENHRFPYKEFNEKIAKLEADCQEPCDLDTIVKDLCARMEKLEQNFSMATLTTAEAIVIINKKLKTPGSITSIQDYDFSKHYKQVKWKKYTGKDPGSGDLIVLTKDNRIEKGVYWHPVDCIHKDSIWQKTDYYIHLDDLRGLPKDES